MSESEKSKPAKESGSTSTTSASSESSSSSSTSKVSSTSNSTPTTSTTTSSAVTSSNSSANVIPKLPSKLHPPLPPPPPPPPKLLPPPAPVTRPPTRHHPPITEAVIKKAFLDFVKDPECLDKAAHYLYESLLDDAVMGVYLEVHNSIKTGSAEAIEGESEDDTAFKIVDTPNYDVFGMSTARKAMDCNCPNCDRLVAASRFATHLENCMGMGRKTSRVASRRVANAKEGNSSYFYANPSDDDDDTDRSSEKRRKKIQSSRTNGSKKNGKSS